MEYTRLGSAGLKFKNLPRDHDLRLEEVAASGYSKKRRAPVHPGAPSSWH